MNLLSSIGILLLSAVTGVMIVHLIWAETDTSALLFKLFLGFGVGPGITSFAYFLYLLVFAGQHFFIYIQVAIFILVLLISIARGRLKNKLSFHIHPLNYWQIGLLATVFLTIGFSIVGASSEWIHRPYGTWDAFMIYNRTARFIFRDQTNWSQSFSSQIDPYFKADYPLLIPLNIASAWDVIGHETNYVPLIFSGLYIFACTGLFASALALTKSIWQAFVGVIILLNTAFFILSGASQTADVPLSFFILSTAALIYLYVYKQEPGLLVLAGLTAGLAGWTKNEGELFIVATFAALLVSFVKKAPGRQAGLYLMGLMIPLAFILYFKLFLAPTSDVLSNGITKSIQQIFEWPRHLKILNAYRRDLLGFGESEFEILPILMIYALIFKITLDKKLQPANLTILLMVVFQMVGYYVIYLITPNPLDWQLTFSLERVTLHVYLPLLYLFFVLVTDIRVALNFNTNVNRSENAI